MSDTYEAPTSCPICEPDNDPRIYDVRPCNQHYNAAAGLDDARIAYGIGNISTSGEPDCETSRALNAVIHRGAVIREKIPPARVWTNHDPT